VNVEQKIIDVLLKKPLKTFQSIHGTVKSGRTDTYNTFQKLLKQKIIIKTNKGYEINKEAYDPNLKQLTKGYISTSNIYLKELSKTKPLFKNIKVEKVKTKTPRETIKKYKKLGINFPKIQNGIHIGFWLNPKGRQILKNYLLLIDDLFGINNSLTYELIKLSNKNPRRKIIENQQKIIFHTTKSMLKKLRRRYEKEIIALDKFIYWNSPSLRKLNSF